MTNFKIGLLASIFILAYFINNCIAKDHYGIFINYFLNWWILETLGIPRDAPDRQIKKSFHKLAQKYHPDVNPNNEEASKKYIEITKGT